jgi:hypothetical protein
MLIPILLGGTLLAATYKVATKKKGMTPERKKVFDAAIRSLQEPSKLEELATSFEKEGLKAEGGELRKRANLLKLAKSTDPNHKQVVEGRKEAFKKAMSSKDPAAIKRVAEAFHKVGHYAHAATLRKYAKGLFKPSTSAPKVGAEEGFAGDRADDSPEV